MLSVRRLFRSEPWGAFAGVARKAPNQLVWGTWNLQSSARENGEPAWVLHSKEKGKHQPRGTVRSRWRIQRATLAPQSSLSLSLSLESMALSFLGESLGFLQKPERRKER